MAQMFNMTEILYQFGPIIYLNDKLGMLISAKKELSKILLYVCFQINNSSNYEIVKIHETNMCSMEQLLTYAKDYATLINNETEEL